VKHVMRSTLDQWLLSAVMVLSSVLGTVASAWAASSTEVHLAQLHADLQRAAAAALLGAASTQRAATSIVVRAEEPEPELSLPPDWQRRLSPQAWSAMRQSFAAAGVPPEFLSVGWVESRVSGSALSPKGARGIWQLMPATARRYGLEVTPRRDDRTDLVRSTRVAARYLADLNRQFGDWLLTLAAYNAGPQRVEAAIVRAGNRNFWQLRPWLPAETREYVPAVLAAMSSPPASEPSAKPASALQSRRRGRTLVAPPAPPAEGPATESATD
jgi:soluble lytic murein transglycosylase-like protein